MKRPKRIRIRSHRIEVAALDYGNEDRTPMLLLHGMRDLAWSLDPLALHFGERFRVVSGKRLGGHPPRAIPFNRGWDIVLPGVPDRSQGSAQVVQIRCVAADLVEENLRKEKMIVDSHSHARAGTVRQGIVSA